MDSVRNELLDDFLSLENDRDSLDAPLGRRTRRTHRNLVATSLATAGLSLAGLFAPAILALPSSTSTAATSCSIPNAVAKDHTKWCGRGAGHYTYEFTGRSSYLSGGYWRTCYNFKYYRWMMGCQFNADGPYSTRRCP